MNGDGFDDIIVGALKMNAAMTGSAYIIYGQKLKPQHALVLTVVSTDLFTVLSGTIYSWFGYSVSGAGKLLFILFNQLFLFTFF